MPITSFKHLSTVVVYLFSQDYDLQPLGVDSIRELGFPKVANENGVIQFADLENARAVRLQPKRVEFEFAKIDSLAPELVGAAVVKFLNKVGNKRISALGTNYMSQVVMEGVSDAGAFIKNTFLRDEARLSATLGKSVIASSTRFFAGTPNDYYDIRLSLTEIGKPAFLYNLHVHKDITEGANYKHEEDLLSRLKEDKVLLPDLFDRVTK